jgi:hypothetical protein
MEHYLKEHLKLSWISDGDELFIGLCLDDEVISKIKFEQY